MSVDQHVPAHLIHGADIIAIVCVCIDLRQAAARVVGSRYQGIELVLVERPHVDVGANRILRNPDAGIEVGLVLRRVGRPAEFRRRAGAVMHQRADADRAVVGAVVVGAARVAWPSAQTLPRGQGRPPAGRHGHAGIRARRRHGMLLRLASHLDLSFRSPMVEPGHPVDNPEPREPHPPLPN